MCDSASPWLSAWDRAGAPRGLEAFDSDSLCVSRGKQARGLNLVAASELLEAGWWCAAEPGIPGP